MLERISCKGAGAARRTPGKAAYRRYWPEMGDVRSRKVRSDDDEKERGWKMQGCGAAYSCQNTEARFACCILFIAQIQLVIIITSN